MLQAVGEFRLNRAVLGQSAGGRGVWLIGNGTRLPAARVCLCVALCVCVSVCLSLPSPLAELSSQGRGSLGWCIHNTCIIHTEGQTDPTPIVRPRSRVE